jgi:hypothetical protein
VAKRYAKNLFLSEILVNFRGIRVREHPDPATLAAVGRVDLE